MVECALPSTGAERTLVKRHLVGEASKMFLHEVGVPLRMWVIFPSTWEVEIDPTFPGIIPESVRSHMRSRPTLVASVDVGPATLRELWTIAHWVRSIDDTNAAGWTTLDARNRQFWTAGPAAMASSPPPNSAGVPLLRSNVHYHWTSGLYLREYDDRPAEEEQYNAGEGVNNGVDGDDSGSADNGQEENRSDGKGEEEDEFDGDGADGDDLEDGDYVK